ncbi:MAG: IS21 family transposase [Actinomycetales bacterium]|nr:IS21 family transposase [Actinomycetales bacterium]
MISLEDWAEIRRLHRAEGVAIKEIARRLGVARNTVRAALAADRVPRYERALRGSLVDAVEPEVRKLLREFPRMPATVIAQRIGWTHSLTILKDRIRVIRPEYVPLDPADRLVHEPGVATQCDLWFPDIELPVGHRQVVSGRSVPPVLTMTLAFSRFITAVMLPSRCAGDLLAGMWSLIRGTGAVTKTLVWDLESAIGKGRRVSAAAAGFAGTLATSIRLLPARDPESKGIVERTNGFLETSFLPGRTFAGPADFNAQLGQWLTTANTRMVRSSGSRPVEALPADLAAMTALPPIAPVTGTWTRVRLGRDYYVRVDTCDYSVHPRVIGRLVDVHATPETVEVTCAGERVAAHPRCWARRVTVTDPAHQRAAAQMRTALAADAARRERARRVHADGHPVTLRVLSDYDLAFGVDFDPAGGGDVAVHR